MDKKMVELLDSAQTISTLALMIAQKSIDNHDAKEVAQRYMEDAMKELWRTRQALREIIRLQDLQ